MSKQVAYWIMGALLLSTAACGVSANLPSAADTSPAAPQVAPSVAAPSPSVAQRPVTATATMSVEGEETEITLQLLDEPSLPFTTYIPAEDFVEEIGSSEEGTGVRFYFSPTGVPDENAYVYMFFPSDPPTADELTTELLGEDGLLAANGWRVIQRSDTSGYDWAEAKILYEQDTPEDLYLGTIYIGEHNGDAFLAFTHYPAEYGDGFEPRAAMLLENLEFRAE